MGSQLILYDYLFSGNAYKVRLLLTQLGLTFQYRPLDILAGETQTPWFLRKNPMGQVPVLELHDGSCLRESSAILMHVAERTVLYPTDALLRTRVHEWLAFEQSNVDQVIARARFRRVFPHAIPTSAEEHAAWQRHGHRALAVMNDHLRTRAFYVGERYTIADIALYAYTHCAGEGGFDLGRYPAIELWCERVRGMDDHLPMNRVPGS